MRGRSTATPGNSLFRSTETSPRNGDGVSGQSVWKTISQPAEWFIVPPMQRVFAFLMTALALGLAGSVLLAEEPSPVLDSYVKVSKALANDDLAAAKTAAAELVEVSKSEKQEAISAEAAKVAAATSLGVARKAFKAVSAEAAKLAAGKDGYHLMTCPMVDADWVQKSTTIENPYMGKAMLDCGTEKK